MSWTTSDIPDLSGKTIVVTGANSGIGYFAALELARAGGHVVMACRSEERGKDALKRLQEALPDASAELALLDLANLSSIADFAEHFLAKHEALDLLINNAGIMAIPRRETADGFEMQFGTNHLGHFALTGHLIECILATPDARVVNVSSMAHTMGRMNFDDLHHEHGYKKWPVYGQSKLANILFSRELQRRLEQADASAISVTCHPGYAATNLQFVGPKMSGSFVSNMLMQFGNAVMAQPAEAGAWPTLYAATSPEMPPGGFVGPKSMGHMRGAPEVHASNRASRDPQAAARLWEISVELTGIDYAPLEG